MNVLLVSQCSKKALTETRRVLDQFAERCGDRTWQTAITQIGLNTLRKMLKQTARRNSAVACHWIKGRNRTELLWIIGNQRKFNQQGTVPTNMTGRDILRIEDENNWHHAQAMTLLSGIAGLFHDFGKANQLFQAKLKPSRKGKQFEPYRHEWVSLRMFCAFVKGLDDKQWLQKLARVSSKDDKALWLEIEKDHPEKPFISPFAELPEVAKAVAWLVLTHHKLPKYYQSGDEKKWQEDKPDLEYMDEHLEFNLRPDWNSPQISNNVEKNWSKSQLENVWHCKKGSPLNSRVWCAKAQTVAKRALGCGVLFEHQWLAQPFSLHLSRLALMMADHYYSSLPDYPEAKRWRDTNYKILANTDRETGQPKQQLDEHLIGVYRNSLNIVRMLPALKDSLPAISRRGAFKKRNSNSRFIWQDKAFDLARGLQRQSKKQGFFGINMASTGQGKTLANARIMYGLSDEQKGCRFSVALGLRTLTLQTGRALADRLNLDEEDIATLIGSQSVLQLDGLAQKQLAKHKYAKGSESADALVDPDQQVRYEGNLGQSSIKKWLEKSPKLNKLVNAPVLVSTIDHLTPATEAEKGGKQIAPMLRLLSSDLVLDEVDEFSKEDLHAICRLVNWAGLLGARVLLSSATLSPVEVQTLFSAYQQGRKKYLVACGGAEQSQHICCAWFDEKHSHSQLCENTLQLEQQHLLFVQKRVEHLNTLIPKHKARIVAVEPTTVGETDSKQLALLNMAEVVHQSIHQLHQSHKEKHPDKNCYASFGVVRLANINTLVALAKQLLTISPQANTCIHYCIYHSQFPMVVRSAIESQLDRVLNRSEPEQIWQQESIKQAIAKLPNAEHIFVLLASPVIETGRDNCFSWGIAEPSSIRALIQLCGRILRHRQIYPERENLHVLSSNLQGLTGDNIAFSRPGYESSALCLRSHQLQEVLNPEQYQVIHSVPRIVQDPDLVPEQNLVALEHAQLHRTLLGNDNSEHGKGLYAALWWQQPAHLSYELQRQTRFRQSTGNDEFVLRLEDEIESYELHQWKQNGELKPATEKFVFEASQGCESQQLTIQKGNDFWGHFDYQELIIELAEELQQEVLSTSISFGALSLPNYEGDKLWQYHPRLGCYRALS